jgi:L-threonylcarbamoyladenylate synthase
MEIISKDEFELKKDLYKKKLLDGAIFVYPTDTIYGIGCDARNYDAIKKIRKLKKRPKQPFSVIAPSKEWIIGNCLTTEGIEDWLEKLPGLYTFILNIDSKDVIANNVNPNDDSVGVRIPDNWFSKYVEFFGFPVITTAVNVSGKEFMTSMENLDDSFKGHIDFIIYEGEKHGKPSQLVDFRSEDIKLINRG